MPSGGGYGPALRRAVDAIEDDLRDGLLEREKVESGHAVRLAGDTRRRRGDR